MSLFATTQPVDLKKLFRYFAHPSHQRTFGQNRKTTGRLSECLGSAVRELWMRQLRIISCGNLCVLTKIIYITIHQLVLAFHAASGADIYQHLTCHFLQTGAARFLISLVGNVNIHWTDLFAAICLSSGGDHWQFSNDVQQSTSHWEQFQLLNNGCSKCCNGKLPQDEKCQKHQSYQFCQSVSFAKKETWDPHWTHLPVLLGWIITLNSQLSGILCLSSLTLMTRTEVLWSFLPFPSALFSRQMDFWSYAFSHNWQNNVANKKNSCCEESCSRKALPSVASNTGSEQILLAFGDACVQEFSTPVASINILENK